MENRPRAIRSLARLIGAVLGSGLAIVIIAGWRVPPVAGSLPAGVTIVGQPSGELSVRPAGVVLEATELLPGGDTASSRRLELRSQTAVPLDVRLDASPATGDLDDSLWIEISSAGAPVFKGPLRRLRRGTDRPILVQPGAHVRVRVRAWIPAGIDEAGIAGRHDEVRIGLRSSPVGG
ncbi:MAG: hypothetical protein M3245_01620 [Actinomycetota bacterium]|nr:hypothetical protein [Actinomycetota bacterium]